MAKTNGKMIELTDKDLKFKGSSEFMNKRDNIINAASILNCPQPDLIKNSFGINNDSLIEVIASFYGWKRVSDGLSEYVYGRIKTFQQEQRTNHEIANWLRRMAK